MTTLSARIVAELCRMNEIYPLVSQRMKDELSQCEEVKE